MKERADGRFPKVTGYDPSVPPPEVLPVVFVSGTPYDMGRQYGQQASAMIARNACATRATLPASWNWDEVIGQLDSRECIVAEKAPELIDLWHGIADGAEVLYDDVRLLNMLLAHSTCSTISAWGSATKSGETIAGSNLDASWRQSSYTVILIAHPSRGNSFITAPVFAGALGGGCQLNNMGLVCMGSSGQAARPEDRQPGVPVFSARAYVAWQCDKADEAQDMVLSLNIEGATSAHLVDIDARACVVEHTSALDAVRYSGDFGEHDYLVAANHFLVESMQSALHHRDDGTGGDTVFRYASEEQLLKGSLGSLTVESFMGILGCHDFWDGEAWHDDVWSLEPAENARSARSPEPRHVWWKTLARTIAVPSQKTCYIMQGSVDTRSSVVPYSTGQFCKLTLADSPSQVTADAQFEAELMVWHAARDLDLTEGPSAAREASLEQAKLAMWEGINRQAQAATAEDADAARLLYGQAVTCFCRAQMRAKQAQTRLGAKRAASK